MTDIKELLIKHEGLRLKPYRDTVGKLTIGVGRNLDDVGITKEEAEYLLDNDIRRATVACRENFPWFDTLTETRQCVLIDMCFNIGINALLGFKNTLKCIEQGDYKGAADNMINSKWAAQVKGRAVELAQMMREG